MRRRAALAALLLLLAPGSRAQAPCVQGFAWHEGTPYACHRVDLLARVPLEAMGARQGNSLWGWTDPETGREIALMGLDTGLFFVDVTAPTRPLLLGLLPAEHTPSLWRDVRVYRHAAYVVSEAPGHGVQVFDLRRLRGLTPDPARRLEPDTVFRGDGTGPSLGSAHTLAVNEETGYAYAVGAQTAERTGWACGGGLYILRLTDPLAPRFAGCLETEGYTHEVTCVRYRGPDTRYTDREICFAANPASPRTGTGGGYDRLTIVDATDKARPVALAEALYPNPGYAHQAWPTDDHRFVLFNDELDEVRYGFTTRTLVFDVSDLERPTYVGHVEHGTRSIDHNLYVRGRYAFAAHYTTGLRILDLDGLAENGPGAVRTVAWFDTHPEHDDPVFRGAWNVYPFFASGTLIVSDINRGLFVLRADALPTDAEPDPPGAPTLRLDLFPNPAATGATARLELATAGPVRVVVLDLLGRPVATLYDGFLAAGTTTLPLDTRRLRAGTYVVRADAGDTTASARLTVAR